MREYFKSDGVIDDDSRCELKTFTEKIGIEAETMELLIVSVANDYKKGTVPAVSHKRGLSPLSVQLVVKKTLSCAIAYDHFEKCLSASRFDDRYNHSINTCTHKRRACRNTIQKRNVARGGYAVIKTRFSALQGHRHHLAVCRCSE